MIITVIELKEIFEDSPTERRCKSEDTHSWGRAIVGEICDCNTWQVVRVISYTLIEGMNAEGETQIFERG